VRALCCGSFSQKFVIHQRWHFKWLVQPFSTQSKKRNKLHAFALFEFVASSSSCLAYNFPKKSPNPTFYSFVWKWNENSFLKKFNFGCLKSLFPLLFVRQTIRQQRMECTSMTFPLVFELKNQFHFDRILFKFDFLWKSEFIEFLCIQLQANVSFILYSSIVELICALQLEISTNLLVGLLFFSTHVRMKFHWMYSILKLSMLARMLLYWMHIHVMHLWYLCDWKLSSVLILFVST